MSASIEWYNLTRPDPTKSLWGQAIMYVARRVDYPADPGGANAFELCVRSSSGVAKWYMCTPDGRIYRHGGVIGLILIEFIRKPPFQSCVHYYSPLDEIPVDIAGILNNIMGI